ncbi:hypothetical protein [Salinicoccus roseus]|nr:hypothetical protein [Salinicoccus roseus]
MAPDNSSNEKNVSFLSGATTAIAILPTLLYTDAFFLGCLTGAGMIAVR